MGNTSTRGRTARLDSRSDQEVSNCAARGGGHDGALGVAHVRVSIAASDDVHRGGEFDEVRNLREVDAITEVWLSRQLRDYGVLSKTVWIGEESAKGYSREDFRELFARYTGGGV